MWYLFACDADTDVLTDTGTTSLHHAELELAFMSFEMLSTCATATKKQRSPSRSCCIQLGSTGADVTHNYLAIEAQILRVTTVWLTFCLTVGLTFLQHGLSKIPVHGMRVTGRTDLDPPA